MNVITFEADKGLKSQGYMWGGTRLYSFNSAKGHELRQYVFRLGGQPHIPAEFLFGAARKWQDKDLKFMVTHSRIINSISITKLISALFVFSYDRSTFFTASGKYLYLFGWGTILKINPINAEVAPIVWTNLIDSNAAVVCVLKHSPYAKPLLRSLQSFYPGARPLKKVVAACRCFYTSGLTKGDKALLNKILKQYPKIVFEEVEKFPYLEKVKKWQPMGDTNTHLVNSVLNRSNDMLQTKYTLLEENEVSSEVLDLL